ncbi:uncharacterized protein MELLADRAFT_84218 [Melampsora larici-populina 98AG31]|uniref:Uncharacterized protein n=1 Tax=Melampsora larici-populina (strain 98AG31 / pathotype 3-4-7) TaxID=747676 RepID=F4SC03_MELLP|nr:uncharacterized protein MELLADRAFT_84218 [Melampsora larici-populina 98AG31]EGF97830.1 hypothetical protein MELLADRAFT_84218 [Melampsora larici-populina 98AG31]
MSSDLDPGWEKRRREKFPVVLNESDLTSLPGVTYLSDLLIPIDVKRQTGFSDNDLPPPFKIAKSYAHVPHELLAPDGYPSTGNWLLPACQFAVLGPDKISGKGRLVQRALDYYCQQGYENVPEPLPRSVKTHAKETRNSVKAALFAAAKQADQSADSVKRTFDRKLTRFNDPILPFENLERTMEIISNLYTIVTHGSGQFVDRQSKKLICTFSYEDLECVTTEQRDAHQKDVTTILMATKLFRRLPLPPKVTTSEAPAPNSHGQVILKIPILRPPINQESLNNVSRPLMDETPPRCLIPGEKESLSPQTPLGSSPLSSLSSSDSEDTEMDEVMNNSLSNMTPAEDINSSPLSSLDSSPLSSLPPSDSEDTDMEDLVLDLPEDRTIHLNEPSTVKTKKGRTTNGALIAGRMYCFGQTFLRPRIQYRARGAD